MSALGCLALLAVGVTWWVHPPAPSWWPVEDRWWLVGGWATGLTIIVSGIFRAGAARLLVPQLPRDQAGSLTSYEPAAIATGSYDVRGGYLIAADSLETSQLPKPVVKS